MRTVSAFILFSLLETSLAFKESCRDVYDTEEHPVSGYYTIHTMTGTPLRLFCDFYQDIGYTYIHKDDLDLLTEEDLLQLYSENDHVIARILYTDNSQRDVRMEQVSEYRRRYPLSISLSTPTGYEDPLNQGLKPYLYIGFLPEGMASINQSRQGYSAGGHDVTFTNCEGNPNSYLTVIQNPFNLAESRYWLTCGGKGGCAGATINYWINVSQPIPTDRIMTEDYYYQYEMHMGGCGGYISTKSNEKTVTGVAIGLAFVTGTLTTKAPMKEEHAEETVAFGVAFGTCVGFVLILLLAVFIFKRFRQIPCKHHRSDNTDHQPPAYRTLENSATTLPHGPVQNSETSSNQPVYNSSTSIDSGRPNSYTQPKEYLTSN